MLILQLWRSLFKQFGEGKNINMTEQCWWCNCCCCGGVAYLVGQCSQHLYSVISECVGVIACLFAVVFLPEDCAQCLALAAGHGRLERGKVFRPGVPAWIGGH